jgi:hypothetical protein
LGWLNDEMTLIFAPTQKFGKNRVFRNVNKLEEPPHKLIWPLGEYHMKPYLPKKAQYVVILRNEPHSVFCKSSFEFHEIGHVLLIQCALRQKEC